MPCYEAQRSTSSSVSPRDKLYEPTAKGQSIRAEACRDCFLVMQLLG